MITVTLNRAILGVGFDGALHVSVTLDSWAPVVSSNCTLGESVKNTSYTYMKNIYIIIMLLSYYHNKKELTPHVAKPHRRLYILVHVCANRYSKHQTLDQRCLIVGPPTTTPGPALNQHWFKV